MNTKWLRNVLCMALVVAFVSSCNDEDPISNKVEEGLSASMNLSVGVPIIEPVEMTRGINDYESMIDELVLVMFSHTSPRKEILDLTDKIASVESNDNTGYRKYSLTEDVKTRSGEYTVYAIANFTSPYCGLTLAELQDENLTEAKLKDKLARNANNVCDLTGAHRMPMTQVIDKFIILSDEEVNNGGEKNRLTLQLKRVMAHIEFNFKNAQENGKDKVSFTPYEYTIYHLPDGAYLMNHDNNLIDNNAIEDDNNKVHYFNTEAINTGGSTFDFFMLENVREKKELSNYTDRDKWIHYNSDGSKDFINAPDSSTYVVVKGTYYGTGVDNDNVSKYYAGECTYTIHLGGKDNGDFSINRNEFHKYTITISGVNTITKEALGSVEDDVYGGDIPGAEGVLRLVSNTFILDAHYERVRVEISKDNYDSYLNNETKGEHTILINTPKTKHENKTIQLIPIDNKYDFNNYNGEEDDIYWIHFMKPEDIEKVPRYDNKKAGDILDFLSNPENYCIQNGTDGNYYTYAYVDEYFYEDIHPKEFVNVVNRSFILDPKNISESSDKNSTVIDFLLFDVSQRSIKSSFDMNKIDKGDLPYGIETWNETAGLLWDDVTNIPTDLSSDQGLVNTKRLLDENNIKTLNDDVWSYIGYRYNVSSNSKARHRWYDAEHYKDWETKYTDEDIDENINVNVTNPLIAVLARNRVYLDSNNEIILDSSVKWYLPAISQYLITWLGQNRLQEDTRLMDVSLLTKYENAKAMDITQHYYTSSTAARRIYWQDQGSCWSRIVDWEGVSEGKRHKMRCMRNLRNDYLDKILNDGLSKNSPVVFPVEREGRTFILGAIANSRSQYMEGGYNIHTERETENYLYSKFKVATPKNGYFYDRANNSSTAIDQDYYCCGFSLPTGTSSWGYNSNIVESMNSIAATYYEEEDKSDLGKWRVPNQRELMIIAVMDHDTNDQILPKGVSDRVNVLTTTWFTGWQNTNRLLPFLFDSGSVGSSDYVMTLAAGLSGSGVLLFVRDVK